MKTPKTKASLEERIKELIETNGKISFKILFEDDNPTQVTQAPWIMAVRRKGVYPPKGKTEKPDTIDKWLVFVNVKYVDEVWKKIKIATENGLLGSSSKVATAKSNPSVVDPDKKVICIYTYDYTDRDDVMRVREELRKIGIVNKIPYKTDVATRKGLYKVNGNSSISIYYE